LKAGEFLILCPPQQRWTIRHDVRKKIQKVPVGTVKKFMEATLDM
jgi:hypothetical protein